MSIHVLDSETIDRIAAGEVVERPSSVVKELVENSIDAGAKAITVEVKEGGIELVRVTDDGCGIDRTQLSTAFLRHATSKISDADDLEHIASLGFRGEALSSIAAVSRVEIITKTPGTLTGTRMLLEGAKEVSLEEIGAPDGTTFIMRNLFFNTPVRRKFLKQPATEGGYIVELMEHLALSRPDISFQLKVGNQLRFHTSGNGDLREVIYRIYGREIATQLVPIQVEEDGIRIEGYLGKPVLVRSNRNFEIYFINGRFIRSNVIAKAIEEGYRQYLMQHKFPLCVLHISMDPEKVDVNVHPSKMDVRFQDPAGFSRFLSDRIFAVLRGTEMIPEALLIDEKEQEKQERKERKNAWKEHAPEIFEHQRESAYRAEEAVKFETLPKDANAFAKHTIWQEEKHKDSAPHRVPLTQEDTNAEPLKAVWDTQDTFFTEAEPLPMKAGADSEKDKKEPERNIAASIPQIAEATQQNLFEERILSVPNRSRYRIIGQVFDTYWLIEFEDKLMMIDQHAAHEKVKYERLMKHFHEKEVTSQRLMPPIIVSLSGQEEVLLHEYQESFVALGFEVESFGGSEYALRAVPQDLYGCGERELFLAVLDELSTEGNAMGKHGNGGTFQAIEEKIASMSCKAAVKGNNRLSFAEAQMLIDELLTLDNPYNCPHGRPTIVTVTETELEKKFKRIV